MEIKISFADSNPDDVTAALAALETLSNALKKTIDIEVRDASGESHFRATPDSVAGGHAQRFAPITEYFGGGSFL